MKFEIHQPDDQPKKKFEIIEPEKKKFTIENPKKKFEIHGREKTWFKQENLIDCGPCLILNVLQELNVEIPEKTIEAVRTKAGQMRGGTNSLAQSEWFRSTDVGGYFAEAGLGVDEYASLPFEKAEKLELVREIFDAQDFQLIYITLGNHFKGILNKDGELMILDSLNTGPQHIGTSNAWKLIENTVLTSTERLIGRVGVVRRNNPGFRLT